MGEKSRGSVRGVHTVEQSRVNYAAITPTVFLLQSWPEEVDRLFFTGMFMHKSSPEPSSLIQNVKWHYNSFNTAAVVHLVEQKSDKSVNPLVIKSQKQIYIFSIFSYIFVPRANVCFSSKGFPQNHCYSQCRRRLL